MYKPETTKTLINELEGLLKTIDDYRDPWEYEKVEDIIKKLKKDLEVRTNE